MRGSVEGLVRQLISSPRSQEAFLELFDIFFSGFFIGPLIMIYWYSTTKLMDLCIFPDFPIWSAVLTTIMGLCVGLLLCVFQDYFERRLTPEIGWMYYILTRLYTCVGGLVNVAACRGLWNILENVIIDPDLIVLTTLISSLALLWLKGVRNIISAPYSVSLDLPEGYFDGPTFYKQSSKETMLYILDCIFSVTVVGSLVVFVWRGSWALLDIYLYPDDPVSSCWTSLIVGYALVVFAFAVQVPMRWATSRLHGAARLLLADVYHFVSFLATVNVWRGVWGLLDIYFFPDTPKISNWCSHIISLTLLILLNCSNSVLVRGVYIDAEEPDGECVVFPCHYLRLYFHRERTKKRHKRALVAAAAASTRKTEESSVPLQIPEEKV